MRDRLPAPLPGFALTTMPDIPTPPGAVARVPIPGAWAREPVSRSAVAAQVLVGFNSRRTARPGAPAGWLALHDAVALYMRRILYTVLLSPVTGCRDVRRVVHAFDPSARLWFRRVVVRLAGLDRGGSEE